MDAREPYPTLYPREVVRDIEESKPTEHDRKRSMVQLTARARNNRQNEREKERRTGRRGRDWGKGRKEGTRIVSDRPERKTGGESGRCLHEQRIQQHRDYSEDGMEEERIGCSRMTR
eukprot:3237303-Pleurochrysis_carterae.AAC.1